MLNIEQCLGVHTQTLSPRYAQGPQRYVLHVCAMYVHLEVCSVYWLCVGVIAAGTSRRSKVSTDTQVDGGVSYPYGEQRSDRGENLDTSNNSTERSQKAHGTYHAKTLRAPLHNTSFTAPCQKSQFSEKGRFWHALQQSLDH